MNPPIVRISNVEEDPHEFLKSVYNILIAMRVNSREKGDLSSYKLSEVSQVGYYRVEEFNEFFLESIFHIRRER